MFLGKNNVPFITRPVALIVAPRISYLSRTLPRLFRKAGAHLVFAAPEGCSVRSSRYVDEIRTFDSAAPGAVTRLERLIEEVEPTTLVVVEEHLVQEILQLPEQAAPHARRLLRLHPSLSSRAGFHLWAAARGIRVPEGVLCHSTEEALAALDRLGPIFLKRDRSSGGNGVRQASTPDEVIQAWKEVGDTSGMIVQRALHGSVGITDMIVKDGRVQAWVSSEKWRTLHQNGPSVARRLCKPEGMHELVLSVAEQTGFHGLGGFDWVVDTEDGLPRLIEFHPRPPSGFGLGRWAGVAYEQAIASLLETGEEKLQQPDPATFIDKDICCYFPDHPLASLKRREWNELRRWLPSPGSRSWSMVPWSDPAMLLQMIAQTYKRKKNHHAPLEGMTPHSLLSGLSIAFQQGMEHLVH